MIVYVATAVTFAAGVFLLPALIPGARVRGGSETLKAAAVGGVLSAALGKLLWIVLTLVFFPIRLLGPVGPVLAQAIVNGALLVVGSQMFDAIRFKSWSSLGWAAVALTLLQVAVASIG